MDRFKKEPLIFGKSKSKLKRLNLKSPASSGTMVWLHMKWARLSHDASMRFYCRFTYIDPIKIQHLCRYLEPKWPIFWKIWAMKWKFKSPPQKKEVSWVLGYVSFSDVLDPSEVDSRTRYSWIWRRVGSTSRQCHSCSCWSRVKVGEPIRIIWKMAWWPYNPGPMCSCVVVFFGTCCWKPLTFEQWPVDPGCLLVGRGVRC